jgi:hypothetical protein
VSTARTPARHVHRAKDPDQPFVVRKSRIAGRGAFATRRIRKGTRIIEYLGERITHKEADRRYDDAAMAQHHTFLFAVDGTHVIDAAVRGNDARFINHSCDPNCEAIDEDGHIFIEAIRNIQPGDELTYDYQFERDADGEMDEAHYPCFCGTAKCRGTILAETKEEKKEKGEKGERRGGKKKRDQKKRDKKKRDQKKREKKKGKHNKDTPRDTATGGTRDKTTGTTQTKATGTTRRTSVGTGRRGR